RVQLTEIISKRSLRRLSQCCAEERHEQNDKEQTGEDIQHIQNTHHNIVNAPTKEARDASIKNTDDQADDRTDKSHSQRNPRPIDNPAEQIAAKFVCSDRILLIDHNIVF